MIPGPHITRHATYVGMLHGSQGTFNRLEHLMSNPQRLDPLTRQRIQSWLERAKSNDSSPVGHWDMSAS